MPSLANITVKKADGTTDITYTGVVPSSGDSTPAIWKSQTVGSAQAHQPELRLVARDSADKKKRILRMTFLYPSIQTDSTTGRTTVVNRAFATCDFTFDTDMPQTDVNEAVAQFFNLGDSSLIVDCVKVGYSAT